MSSHAGILSEGLRTPKMTLKGDPRQPHAIDADERYLRRLLAVMASVALLLGLASAVAFIKQGELMFGGAAIGLGCVAAAMLIVRRMVGRSNLAFGARLVSWALLALCVGLLAVGNRAPMLALTALLGVLVAVPYVDGRELRRLAIAAYAVILVIGLGWASEAPQRASRSWPRKP